MYPVQVKCQKLEQRLKTATEAERQWSEWRAELKHVTEDAIVALRTEMYLLKHANRKLKLKLLDAMHQLDQSMPIKAGYHSSSLSTMHSETQAFCDLCHHHEKTRAKLMGDFVEQMSVHRRSQSDLIAARKNAAFWMQQ